MRYVIFLVMLTSFNNSLSAFVKGDIVKVFAIDFKKLFEGKENDKMRQRLYELNFKDMEKNFPQFDDSKKIFLYFISDNDETKTLMAVPTHLKEKECGNLKFADSFVKFHDGFILLENDKSPYNSQEIGEDASPKVIENMFGNQAVESITFYPKKVDFEAWDHSIFYSFLFVTFDINLGKKIFGNNSDKIKEFNKISTDFLSLCDFKMIKSGFSFNKDEYVCNITYITHDDKKFEFNTSLKVEGCNLDY